MKNSKRIIFSFLILTIMPVALLSQKAYSEEPKGLQECVCNSPERVKSSECLREIRESYFKENKYSEFVDLLRGLCPQKTDIAPYLSYEIALSRYEQLRYLEESQGWDEYFSRGNDYRDDIVSESAKAVKALPKDSPELVYSWLVAYKFHKDQQDSFLEGALSDLTTAVTDYAKTGKDMEPVREVADTLYAYKENAQAKALYKIYTNSLVSSGLKDESLKNTAFKFYEAGNLELSENIYDIYIERVSKKLPKNELLQELRSIAVIFSYSDLARYDISYAEKVFKRIEELLGLKYFDEELIYMRGFNLEKNRQYKEAKDAYSLLLKMYPKSRYADEVSFRLGLISVYALRDLKAGVEYFNKLSEGKNANPYSLGSLYHLGLLKHWQGDSAAASVSYNKLIDKSQGAFSEIINLAKERLKEIEEGSAMEYNLRTFIDAALKAEFANLTMGKVDVSSIAYRPEKGSDLEISSSVHVPSSGCFNVELNYLWSGDLGDARPGIGDPGFKASYKNEGTKFIGLVLISPTGITDYSFILIDVQ